MKKSKQGLIVFASLGLLLLMFSGMAQAVSYTFSGSSEPTCSGGSWSQSGSTWTCSGSFTLNSGDSISPASSINIFASNGMTFNGSNTVGSSSNTVNLQTDWGTIAISSGTIYGSVSGNSGNITLSATTVNGAVNTSGSVNVSGGNITGNVSGNGVTSTSGTVFGGTVAGNTGAVSFSGGSVAGNVSGNGVTSINGTVFGGTISSPSNPISLSGGSVAGNVSGNGVTTNGTTLSNGVTSNSSSLSITGGTITGTIAGNGITIKNATMTSGSITSPNSAINISNSKLGSASSSVTISSSNVVNLTSNTTVYGSVTAGNWPAALTIDGTSQVHGVCNPSNSRCVNNSLPIVTTNAATGLSSSGATLNGTVSSNGLASTVSFNYGTTTSYGSSVTASQSPLAGSASGTAVSAALTGLSCGTTYHYQVTATNTAGTTNGSDATFTTKMCCNQPANTPPGVTLTCQCDTFARSTLSPSPIFGGTNWNVSTSDGTGISPYINQTTGYLRLTENTGSNAKEATVPGIFPANGNYISVEFQHYAYNGSGADGIAVTLSDYSVPAVPGAYGGSLGYAQRSGIVGFAGGWIGVALDEYGNYQNPTEGRIGGSGFIPESVGVRGSGSGMNGYNYLAGTAGLNPLIDNSSSTTPSLGFFYQVIVDARTNPVNTSVTVNRDTTGTGNSYNSLITIPDVYAAATAQGFTQATVPNNWQISFTGSTGGSTNIHEIGALRVCASTFIPPSGGTAGGFNAIDSAFGVPPLAVQNYTATNTHIYTKLEGVPFKLNVAALSSGQLLTTYAITGSKTVTVKLVDNSDSLSNSTLDCTLSCTAVCTSKSAVTGGTQTITFASGASDQGQKQSPNFTINSAYQKLVAIMSDGTTSACSTDAFSVRPLNVSLTSSATNTATSGTPIFKAGSDNFSITATISNPSNYTGVLKINNSAITAASPATNIGTLTGSFPSVTLANPSPTGTFTYSEVGGFALPANSVYDGVVSSVDCAGFTQAACDAAKATTWTGVDSISSKGDCISDSSSNTISAAGLYGCNVGNASASTFGRFVPDHFDTVITLASGVPMTCPTVLTCPTLYNGIVYSGEPFTTNIYARNASGATTLNYDASGFSKAVTLSPWSALGGSTAISNGTLTIGSGSSAVVPASAFKSGTTVVVSPATPLTSTFAFATNPTIPTAIYLRAVDADGETSLRGTPSASIEGGVEVVSGQLKVSNAYGSELLPLTLTATAQFYNSSSVWTTSTTDSVTTLTLPATYTIGSGKTTVAMSPSTGILSGGVLTINLSKPMSAGTATVTPTGVPSYLPLTPGVATFGIYKGNNSIIYMRENY